MIALIHEPMLPEQKRLTILDKVQQNLSQVIEKKIRSKLCSKYTEILRAFHFPDDFLEKVNECV